MIRPNSTKRLLALATALASQLCSADVASILNECDTDAVNDAMASIKVLPDGGSPSWLTLSGSPALRLWYDKQADAGSPMPNIDDFYRNKLGRARIQNAAGTLPAFWIATSFNHSLMAPQVLETLKGLSGDVVVMRVKEDPKTSLPYRFYENAQTSTETLVTKATDATTLYSAVNTGITSSSGARRVLLGYSFSTKAVTPDKTGAKEISTLIDNRFARFEINGTCKRTTGANLCPNEYLVDPVPGGGALRTPPPRPFEDGGISRLADDGIRYPYGNDIFYVNFDNAAAVEKVTAQMQTSVASNPALSGLAADLTVYRPAYDIFMSKHSPTYSRQSPDWLCRYEAGLRTTFQQVSASQFNMFNMLEPRSIDELNTSREAAGYSKIKSATWRLSQQELLQYAHGGLVEYFGGRQEDTCAAGVVLADDVCSTSTNFYKRRFTELLDQVKSWRRNPDKYFMVAARGPKSFNSYLEEYNWQAYLYSVYLLGSGPNTAFKYVSVFQFPLLQGSGRTDGLQVFDQQLLDLGLPTIAIRQSAEGLYSRSFEKALVMVNPHDSNRTVPTASLSGFRPPNTDWATVPKELKPGETFILTSLARNDNVGRLIDFQDQATKKFFAANETMDEAEDGLRVKETTPSYLTDILLNIVKYRTHRAAFTLDLAVNGTRHSDARKILVVAEVDDTRTVNLEKRRQNVAFELFAGALPVGLARSDVVKKPLFRAESISDPAEDILLIRIPNSFKIEKGRQTVRFSPQSELDLEHGHIRFRRWDMIRFSGDFTLYTLKLGDENFVSGPKGF